MALRVALKSLALQPVRSAVLACGFGAGIAAMAGLLGIGQVVLEQSRSPQLAGGGDVVIHGVAGNLANARFVMSSVLASPPLGKLVVAAAPSISDTLYLVEEGRTPLRVHARAGIPSLENELSDQETAGRDDWRDSAADLRWSSPDPADVLRAMDRFHAIPSRGAEVDSWAEWLYFNGRAGDARFYLSFLVGPASESGKRVAGVRMQLERDGRVVAYSDRDEIPAAEVLATAPDLRIGKSSVRLDGLRYRIRLNLQREERQGGDDDPHLTGELTLDAVPGMAMPPFQVRGTRGWVSGYVVPVLAGALGGELLVGGRSVSFEGGSGYHDHNWGYWEGVTWRWGQVAGDDLSIVYGRIIPPEGVVDPDRLPGLLVALGPDGPVGFATNVSIEESGDVETEIPSRVVVRGSGESVDLTLRLTISEAARTRLADGPFGTAAGDSEFLQIRADYHVSGRVAGRHVEFVAPGSAETFRRIAEAPKSNVEP
jgi:hypothetical protein